MQQTISYKTTNTPGQNYIQPSFLKSCIVPFAAVSVCLFTRLLYFGKYIDEWDSVNFAFGLSKGYDILHDQPHFPGYPIYMFVSWIWYKLFGSDIQALVFSGILLSSLAVYPLYELSKRMFSQDVANLTVVLYIVNPQVWLQAEKPLSDAFGLFFVITSILFFLSGVGMLPRRYQILCLIEKPCMGWRTLRAGTGRQSYLSRITTDNGIYGIPTEPKDMPQKGYSMGAVWPEPWHSFLAGISHRSFYPI